LNEVKYSDIKAMAVIRPNRPLAYHSFFEWHLFAFNNRYFLGNNCGVFGKTEEQIKHK
jgi:hypothetical protein